MSNRNGKGELKMDRIRKGESRNCVETRRKNITICDYQHLCKQIKWLKKLAEANSEESETLIGLWELNRCVDVTTATGKAEFLKIYSEYRKNQAIFL